MTFKLDGRGVGAKRTLLMCGVACIALTGCRPERNLTREQKQEQSVERQTPAEVPHTVAPESRSIDEAQLVLAGCGQPLSDTVHDVYTKDEYGPVRTLVYAAHDTVTLDFIPRHPPRSDAQHQVTALPPDTVWVFAQARSGHQTELTAHRLSEPLPCAAQALARFE